MDPKQKLNHFSNSSEDYFKLLPGKEYFQAEGIDGFITYGQSHGVQVGLGDPICAEEQRRELLNKFLDYGREMHVRTVFSDIDSASESLYKCAGMTTMQIGATAVIDIQNFVQSTAHSKNFRNTHNRLSKAGYKTNILKPPHADSLLAELRDVSDNWLTLPGRVERDFFLGYFDETYLQDCDIFTVTNAAGEIEAFVNIVPVFRGVQVTIDLMRHTTTAPPMIMDFLFLELIKIFADEGWQQFDLGMAPFSHIDHPHNIPEHAVKILHSLHAPWFDYAGLEQFKNKFRPEWKPVYFAWDGNLLEMPRIQKALNELMTYSK